MRTLLRSQAAYLVLAATICLAACSGPGPGPSPTAATTMPPTPGPQSPPPATPAPPTTRPTPAFPAPPELIGTWRSELSPGSVATLTIGESRYELARLGSGSGRLEVMGDVMVFSRSTLCQGEGRYRWALEADELRLESIEPDECPGRSDSLDGYTYSRVSR